MELLRSQRLWYALALSVDAHSAPLPHGSGTTRKDQALRDAFEAYFWRYERRITTYLWRMTGNDQSAMDLSQETFLRAWKHFAELNTAAETGPWLFKVATNLALTYLQRQKTLETLPADDTLPGSSDPGTRYMRSEQVTQTLRSLPPKQRSALVLHVVYGLSLGEIAAALNLTPGAVKTTLWRARENFRVTYEGKDNE